MATKQTPKGHDPAHVAQIAAHLLHGREAPEPHHVKAAVKAARLVLDEAYAEPDLDEVIAEEEAAEAAPAAE